jgi:oxalate decarboxylase
LDGDEIHFLIFFDQAMPGDIGFRDSVTALSPAVLAATLGIEPDRLPDLPKTYADPLIVERLNPLGHFDRKPPGI